MTRAFSSSISGAASMGPGGAQPDLPAGTDVIDASLTVLMGLDAYNHWVYSLLRPYVRGRVLEVGCGTGNITQFLARDAGEVVGIEPVERFVRRFDQRFADVPHVTSRKMYFYEMPRPERVEDCFDTVVSCNVLEHIEDDVEAVSMMSRQLRPGGRVVVFVPAGRLAFGRLDRELGHFRRYTKQSLRRVMCESGLQWIGGRYSNVTGLFGWWLNSVVLRRRRVPEGQASAFNRLVPLVRAMERHLPLPFGQSVVGVGRKPVCVKGGADVRYGADACIARAA